MPNAQWTIVDARNPLRPAKRISDTVTRVPSFPGSMVQNGNRAQTRNARMLWLFRAAAIGGAELFFGICSG